MQFFDVTDCKAKIVQPNTNLSEWVKANSPFAVCNASLYNFNNGEPIGTIIEEGRVIHNDGNGYGYGIVGDQASFGGPWEKSWSDYITGYYSPIQNAKYVPPPFWDSYVFGTPNMRIAIGAKDGRLVIITEDNVTLKQFADRALANGVITLVNLDGGGSRHLYYDGKAIYTSPRVPYNALAFFKSLKDEKSGNEKSSSEKTESGKKGEKEEVCPYPKPVRNLLYGCKGEDVKWLQWYLNKKGYKLDIDGKFYSETWKAVWLFQQTWTRWPDGICGPNTRRELLK